MNFDEEFLCSFLLQLRENQLVLKQLLDEEMGDSVSQSFVKKETITHDHPENYKKEYLRYKKMFITCLVISITIFIIFLFTAKEYYREIVEIQNRFITSHNRDLDRIIMSVNRFRIGPQPVN